MATVANFPSNATLLRNKELAKPPDYKPVTAEHEYADGGVALNNSNEDGILEWEIEYDGKTVAQCQPLDDHYVAAKLHNDFTFVDRFSVSHTGVRYKDFDKDHTKTWLQSRRVKLIKTP